MPNVSVTSIRRIAVALGALALLAIIAVLWLDRFMAADGARVMSVREAWGAGLIQGYFLLNLLLLVAAVGMWCLKSWARWVVYLWFPLLSVHNIATEFWRSGSVQLESWLHAVVISALWLGALYPFLASQRAADIFGRAKA